MRGAPIRVEWRAGLRVRGGQFVDSGGAEVHAASFIRQRRVVLDRALLRQRAELRRILTHELFHFVWIRLSNSVRRSWESVLAGERAAHARGELGWSAELIKEKLLDEDAALRTRRWRAYACESFCDTAAWLYSGTARHAEYTLGVRAGARRRAWFAELRRHHGGPLSI